MNSSEGALSGGHSAGGALNEGHSTGAFNGGALNEGHSARNIQRGVTLHFSGGARPQNAPLGYGPGQPMPNWNFRTEQLL